MDRPDGLANLGLYMD